MPETKDEKKTEEEKEKPAKEEVKKLAPEPPRPNYRRPQGGQEEYVRVKLPNKAKREIFAIADQLLGASRIKVLGADGKARMGRIPGKLRKRMWIRQGDLLIIKPWEFQEEKADIVWRYTKTQAISLSKKKLLPEAIDPF